MHFSMVLLVLKYIGLTLLTIVAIIALLLFIVFFVPIRYKGKGYCKDDDFDFSFDAGFLFNFLHFRFLLKADRKVSFKILGIDLLNKKKKEKVKEKTTESEEDRPKSKDENKSLKEDSPGEIESFHIEEDDEEDNPDFDLQKDNFEEEAAGKVKDKKESSGSKVKKYIEIIKTKRFKKAYGYVREKLFKLIRLILPRKYRIEGIIGFDDPATTGTVLSYISMFYGLIYKHVDIKGDFEKKNIDLNFYFKGHITLIRIGVLILTLILDKNIRFIVKCFKEVK